MFLPYQCIIESFDEEVHICCWLQVRLDTWVETSENEPVRVCIREYSLPNIQNHRTDVISKSGLISSKDNYRPIAIASVLSKVLEFIILERIEMFVYTHENQFGFKKQHGTDTCIYVMKEIINRYQRLGSSVYLSFLDASKAFDRINHDTLFKKLVNRNVHIVRLFSGIAISKCLSNGEM